MKLRQTGKPFGLSTGGAVLVFVTLLAVGAGLALLTDREHFLLPAQAFALVYAVAWGLKGHQRLRVLGQRYESHLRRKNGLE